MVIPIRYPILRPFVLSQIVLALICGASAAASTPGTSGESVRFDHLSFVQVPVANAVQCMCQDSKGFIWFGTRHGLMRFDGNVVFPYHPDPDDSNSLAGDHVLSVCEDQNSGLWIGTEGGGLNRLDEASGTMTRVEGATPDESAPQSIVSMCSDRAGVLWIGTRGAGLKRIDRGAHRLRPFEKSFPTPSLRETEAIVSIVEDFSGNLWIGTRADGLARIDHERARVIRYRHESANTRSVSSDKISGLFVGQRGEVWVGTVDAGICRYDPPTDGFIRTPVNTPDLRPFAIESASSFAEDFHGNIWTGSPRGLRVMNPSTGEFREYQHQPDHPNTLGGNTVLALLQDRSGMLLSSSLEGGIDRIAGNSAGPGPLTETPGAMRRSPYVPPVVITGFMLFDNSNKDFVKGREEFDSVEISYKDIFFALGFSVLDYREPAKNHYAFMLEGFDQDWVNIGNKRFARYSNIPPGSYLFRVKGAGADGVWNETGTSVRITISPPFWNTSWFYGLAAVCVLGISLTLNVYRVKRQVRRITEMEGVRSMENRRVRQRAADDFHDEFGHKLTRISLLCQVMKRKLTEGNPRGFNEQIEQLDKMIQTSDDLSMGMRDFLWALNPEKDSAGDAAIRLKDFGDGLFDGSGIAFRVHGTENGIDKVPLQVDWRRHLLLIFKEAMNNSAKHSGCRNVTLDIEHRDGRLVVRLTDDGTGFASNATAGGQGLAGMKKRAEKIQGVLKIESGAGRGTVVEFSGNVPTGPWSENPENGLSS